MNMEDHTPITELEIFDEGKQLLQPDTCPDCGGGNVEATFADVNRRMVDYDCNDCRAGLRVPYYEHIMLIGAVKNAL